MDDVREITLFPSGMINIPPSKSVAHRALICSALGKCGDVVANVPEGEDVTATIRALAGLKPGESLDCGESGTTLRFLVPIAAMHSGETVFTGRGRLMERPLAPFLDAMGVRWSLKNSELRLLGPLKPGTFALPGHISSQFISGLLLVLPLLGGDSEITLTSPLESASYVDLTLDVMEKFGVKAGKTAPDRYYIPGGQAYRRTEVFTVEADYSQAAFFLVAQALGCPCECQGLSYESKQGDRVILDIISRVGPGLKAIDVDVSDIPDLVPPLAVLFSCCQGVSRILRAGRLRYKESDRLISVTNVLNALGGSLVVKEDSLEVHGVSSFRGGRVSSCGDHRIAMMVAVAALRSVGPVFLEGSRCVKKSYPRFWQDFECAPKSGAVCLR